MIPEGTKKMIPLCILKILKEHTDETHRIQQAQISEYLKNEYGLICDRKTVKRALDDLSAFGFSIECDSSNRRDRSGNDNVVCSNWYLVHDFTDAELRLIIDSILFSPEIPDKQRRELIGKIRGLSSNYFRSSVSHAAAISTNRPVNKQNFYTIDILNEAISKGKMVSFIYNVYGHDKKLHPKRSRRYVVSPYQLAAVNGRFYIICNCSGYDNSAHFRVDRITDILLTDTPVRDMRTVKGLENGLSLPRHIAEHIYMFSGESVHVRFRAGNEIVNELIDWFGNDITFDCITETDCIANVYVNRQAMFYWAMQYGKYVEILSPDDLRNDIRNAAELMLERYSSDY